MVYFYAAVSALASYLLARALWETSDPDTRWRHRVRFAAARMGWCLVALALAACDKGEPAMSSGPAFGSDPAYASCEADPDAVSMDACASGKAYTCITMPGALGYGCYQPAASTEPHLLCCPSIAYDGGAS